MGGAPVSLVGFSLEGRDILAADRTGAHYRCISRYHYHSSSLVVSKGLISLDSLD